MLCNEKQSNGCVVKTIETMVIGVSGGVDENLEEKAARGEMSDYSDHT